MSSPAPLTCSKCGASCPRVLGFFEEQAQQDPDSPWLHLLQPEPPAWECPVHGLFELHGGNQVFHIPDTYVLGPNGERLFCL